jgi:hypothetical protein
MMRERQFNMRLSELESARLSAVAEHHGIGEAEVMRLLLKREHDAIKTVKTKRGAR